MRGTPIPFLKAAVSVAVILIGTAFVRHVAFADVLTENYTRTPAGTVVTGPISISFQLSSGQYGEGELDGVTGIQIFLSTPSGAVTEVLPFSNANQYPTFAPLTWTGTLPAGTRVNQVSLQQIGGVNDGDTGIIVEEGGFSIPGIPTGRGDLTPQDVKVTVLPSGCTTDRNVSLLLYAREASDLKISNVPDFSDADWQPFETGTGHTVVMNWTLPDGDGQKTVYVVFRNPVSKLESSVQEATVKLDQATLCGSDANHSYISLQPRQSLPNGNPNCLSDYVHTRLVPYLVSPTGTILGLGDDNVQVTKLSETETLYAFDTKHKRTFKDLAVQILHTGDAASIRFLSSETSLPFDIRLGIYAADLGVVDDILLSSHDRASLPDTVSVDLKGRETLCEAYQLPRLQPGSLFRSPLSGVYLFGKDLKRHAFPDDNVFLSWFSKETFVQTIASFRLPNIPLGPSVTLRPGSLVRIGMDKAYYLVTAGAKLRPILNQILTGVIFGPSWADLVRRVDVSLVTNYVFGSPIKTERDIPAAGDDASLSPDVWPAASATSTMQFDSDSAGVFDGRVVFLGTPYPKGDVLLQYQMYREDGSLITSKDLEIVHDEWVHNFILRNDLTGFQHIHPRDHNGDGIWSVMTHFEEGGIYSMDFDIVPIGGDRLIFRAPLLIGEDPTAQSNYLAPNADLSANDNPFRVVLDVDRLIAGHDLPLTFHLTKDGKPVPKIQSYLDAYGHLVILNKDDTHFYLHLHPTDTDPPKDGEVTFTARFPTPGRYTMFVQFKVDGNLHTFPIAIDVPKHVFPDPTSDMSTMDGPYRLQLLPAKLVAGGDVPLTFELTKDGKSVLDIQTYENEYSHLVMFARDDTSFYQHAHSQNTKAPADGRLSFVVTFPQPGRYTMFVQLLIAARLHTFPITVDVMGNPNKNVAP